MRYARIFISGFVQAVGFRQFIKINADRLKLEGWVRNLPDGQVEAVFQGSKEKIKEMIVLCKKGPFLAEVESVDVVWEETKAKSDLAKEKFEGFEIRV
ncbi:MAG: acylphosphatase [Patescibacteria group bacterium]